MEETIKVLIYIHAFFGGVGLITGIGNFILKKGNSLHKLLGKVYSYSMIISASISLIISKMPNHESLFLFLIGLITIYMVIAGNRALTFKANSKQKADYFDKSVSGIMLLVSIAMIIFGIVEFTNESKLYIFFGVFGVLMTLRDFQTFRNFKEHKNAWLKSHIGRMIGALIASVTAFLVAGLNIYTIFAWVTPTIIGTVYIVYWFIKLKSDSKVI